MFNEWRAIRELRRKITSLKKEEARLDTIPPDDSPPNHELSVLRYRLNSAQQQLDELETKRIMRKVHGRGIKPQREGSWWYEDTDYNGRQVDYLTDIGKAGMSRLIREDKKQSIAWWVTTIIIPLLTAAVSILSLIVALVSVSSK